MSPWDVAVQKKPCPLTKWGGGCAGRARLVCVEDRVCSPGRRHRGGKGLCGSEGSRAGGAAVQCCAFCPLSSCTSLLSGVLALNGKACLALSDLSLQKISREPLSTPGCCSSKTQLPQIYLDTYMLCPIISSSRRNFSKIFFNMIMPPIGFLFFSFFFV